MTDNSDKTSGSSAAAVSAAVTTAIAVEHPGSPPLPAAGKPGAFTISHAPHLAHIGESRAAAIGMAPILDGPEHARATAHRLITAGFNALTIPLFDEGYTLFPSVAMAERGLPRQHPDLSRRDVLAEMSELALDLNVPLLLSVEFLTAGDRGLGVRYPVLRRHRRWAMRNAAGHMLPLGLETQRPLLCPSWRGVVDFYASVCYEAAIAYPISGFILEIPPLVSPESGQAALDFCYCPGCRSRFLNELADDDDPLARHADPDFQISKTYQFRRQIHHAIQNVRNRVLESRSDCLIFLQGAIRREPNTLPLALDTAWYPLAATGAVDGVFVTNYSFHRDDFARELDEDAALFPSRSNLCAALRSIRGDTLIEQIEQLRRHGACGFLAVHAADLPPGELARIEREALLWPSFHIERAPRRAVESNLRRLQYLNAGCPPLSALFRDIARFFSLRWEQLGINDVEAMIANLDNVRLKLDQGVIALAQPAPKVQRLVAQLQKSLFMLCKTLRS